MLLLSKRSILFAAFVAGLVISACDDDEYFRPVADFPDCVGEVGDAVMNVDSSVDFSCITSNRETAVSNFRYSHTKFNPLNSNEIAFIRYPENEFDNCDREIWRYNFCTSEMSFIVGQACYGLNWSTNGWIAFTGTDRHIYKVKPTGDGLTRLTDQGRFNNYASWNRNGDKFIYKHLGDSNNTMKIADQDGNITDTLPDFLPYRWSWRGDSLVYTRDFSGNVEYGFYNISTREKIILDTFSVAGARDFITDIIYLPESNRIYYQHYPETVVVDIQTGEKETILSGADNRFYIWSDVSHDEKYVISTRWDYLGHTGSCRYDAEYTLYIVDIDGGNERKITIPE